MNGDSERPPRSRYPNPGRLRESCQRLRKRKGVSGTYIGRKRRDGRATDEISLVCLVREKRPAGELGEDSRLPEEIRWSKEGGADLRIQTDVQVLESSTTTAGPIPVAGPGDELVREAPATVSVLLEHPEFGRAICTAGHAFQQSKGTIEYPDRPLVSIRNAGPQAATYEGALVRSSIEERADYALVVPTPGTLADNLYADEFIVWDFYYPPHPSDVGRALWVLTGREMLKTPLEGIRADLRIGRFNRRDALLTGFVTVGGDSGAALVDEHLRVWGVLIGSAVIDGDRRSVFQPIHWVLQKEGALIA